MEHNLMMRSLSLIVHLFFDGFWFITQTDSFIYIMSLLSLRTPASVVKSKQGIEKIEMYTYKTTITEIRIDLAKHFDTSIKTVQVTASCLRI